MAKDEPPGETGTEIRLQEKMIKDSSRLGGCGKAKEPPNRKEGVTKMRNNPRRVILSGKPDMAAPHPLITLGSRHHDFWAHPPNGRETDKLGGRFQVSNPKHAWRFALQCDVLLWILVSKM